MGPVGVGDIVDDVDVLLTDVLLTDELLVVVLLLDMLLVDMLLVDICDVVDDPTAVAFCL